MMFRVHNINLGFSPLDKVALKFRAKDSALLNVLHYLAKEQNKM